MKNKILYTAIFILLGTNIFLTKEYKDLEYSSSMTISSLYKLPEELNTYKANIKTNMENCQKSLKTLTVTDFKEENKIFNIGDFFNRENRYLFICRFSENHCEACVDNTIKTLLAWEDSIGRENMLFLSSYRNLRSFDKQRKLYGIDSLQTVNVKGLLGLPVESHNYPYYFILDSTQNVCSLFVPTKKNDSANNHYIKSAYSHYFKNIKK